MGGKVLRCHPMLEGWNASFQLIDTVGRMKKSELEELITWAGMAVGIGDQRIFNFGRFEIKNTKLLNQRSI